MNKRLIGLLTVYVTIASQAFCFGFFNDMYAIKGRVKEVAVVEMFPGSCYTDISVESKAYDQKGRLIEIGIGTFPFNTVIRYDTNGRKLEKLRFIPGPCYGKKGRRRKPECLQSVRSKTHFYYEGRLLKREGGGKDEGEVVYNYDSFGNRVEERIFHGNGELSHFWRFKYNSDGKLIEQRMLLEGEKLQRVEQFSFDSYGNQVLYEKKDSLERVTERLEQKFDSSGNVVEQSEFEFLSSGKVQHMKKSV